MFHGLCRVAHMAKPSWCLLVIVMYFIPARLASATIACALKWVGLNCGANFSYSLTGMCSCSMTHSPRAGTL